jgi:hypothetical protein
MLIMAHGSYGSTEAMESESTRRLGAVSGGSHWRRGPITAKLVPGPTDDSATGPTKEHSRRRLRPKSGPLNSLAPGPLNSLAPHKDPKGATAPPTLAPAAAGEGSFWGSGREN